MVLTDGTNGHYLSHYVSPPSNGSTAEWIVERPTPQGSSSNPGLADFRSVAFTVCNALRNGSNVSLINLPNNQITMFSNDGGHVLALPGGLTPDGVGADFTVYWQNYGP